MCYGVTALYINMILLSAKIWSNIMVHFKDYTLKFILMSVNIYYHKYLATVEVHVFWATKQEMKHYF